MNIGRELPKLQNSWYALEKLCTKCGEYWPADEEFFHRGKDVLGLNTCCKACYYEMPSVQQRNRRGRTLH